MIFKRLLLKIVVIITQVNLLYLPTSANFHQDIALHKKKRTLFKT